MIHFYIIKNEWKRFKELKIAFYENLIDTRTITVNRYFANLFMQAEEHERIIKRLLEEGKLIFY